jgi:predicted flavoprotein YhiN
MPGRARHRALALLLLAAAGLTVAGGAVAFTSFRVSGPAVVRIGQEVRFPTRGLRPHERITVSLAPTLNRGGNCCGIDVIRRARADARGEAILHFKWPSRYYNGDQPVAWRTGARADVIVLAGSGRGLRVVRVRTR